MPVSAGTSGRRWVKPESYQRHVVHSSSTVVRRLHVACAVGLLLQCKFVTISIITSSGSSVACDTFHSAEEARVLCCAGC